MRNAFASEILDLAAADERVVLLSADIGNRLFDKFKEAFPQRFYNCGVAEANMIGVAAGLAMCGLKPVCYTIANFITYRCLEQIRVDLCYHRLPVVVVGTGSGLCYASLGGTHQSCEEMGMMRLLPEMTVMAPCDPAETRACLRAALRETGPCYLRIGKKGEPGVYPEVPAVRTGESIQLREGRHVCLLVAGILMPAALEAAKLLEARGISAEVRSFHTVKPLDEKALARAFGEFRLVVTVEEHSVLGGLGGAVAEWAAPHTARPALLRVGTPDVFAHETLSQKSAREHFGLTPQKIASRILEAIPPAEEQPPA